LLVEFRISEMETNLSFIDYLDSFEYDVAFNLYGFHLKGKPVYSVIEKNWSFDKDPKAKDFSIHKGGYTDQNIYSIISLSRELKYQEYLNEFFEQFKRDLQNKKTEFIDENELSRFLKTALTKLENALKNSKEEPVYYTLETSALVYSETLPRHKDLKLNFNNKGNSEIKDLTNICFVNFVVSKLIGFQLGMIEKTIDFLKTELIDIDISQNEIGRKVIEKIKGENKDEEFQSGVSEEILFTKIKFDDTLNLLTTLFFDLYKEKYLKTSIANLERFIIFSFLDENGASLNPTTIHTYLSKKEKQAKEDVKFIVREKRKRTLKSEKKS
jgi:hypothetical protein